VSRELANVAARDGGGQAFICKGAAVGNYLSSEMAPFLLESVGYLLHTHREEAKDGSLVNMDP
jgi:hypothetical protein